MPQDFSRELRTGVAPIQPVEVRSGLEAVATIAEGASRLFSNLQRPAEQPSQPSFSERQAAWEREGVRRYSSDLSRLQQELDSGAISETEYASGQRLLNANFYGAGYDLNAGQFQTVRQSITGLSDTQFGFTPAQDIINSQIRAGNYGAIAYAQSEAQARGMPLNEESVANILTENAFLQAQIENINTADVANFARNRELLIRGIREETRKQQFALSQLDEQGIIIPAEVSVGSAQEALLTYQSFNDRIPSNITAEERRVFDQEAERLLQPWKALGLIDATNTLVSDALTSNELDLQLRNKLNAYARVLYGENAELSDILATYGITNAARSGQLWDDPRIVTVIPQIEERIANAGLTDKLSEILPNIDELQTRTIFGLNEMLLDRRRATAIGEDMTQSLIDRLPEDQQQVWRNYTPEQAVAQFENQVDLLGGVNLSGIANAPSTEGLQNTFTGLSISMQSIDFTRNAFSREGLQRRLEILPFVIDRYQQVNPTEGAIAEQMVFTAVAETKSQYDLQIRSRESLAFEGGGFIWNAETNSYVVSGTANPTSPSFTAVQSIQTYYDGNLSAAVRDNFSRVPDTTVDEFGQVIRGARGANKRELQQSFDVDTLTELEDLRRSSAYLANLGAQLEPEEFRTLVDERRSASVAELPSFATSVNFGGREVFVNRDMNPALEIVSGQTHEMVQPWAVNNLRAIMDGPVSQIEELFGRPLVINDALPKVGTSREDPNYAEGTGSQHFYGNAVDIDISNMSDADRMRLLESALNAGARGIGLGRTILHIDFRDTYTAWTYETTGDTWGGVSASQLDSMIENYGVRVPSFTRNFNARGASAQITSDNDVETEGSAALPTLNLGGAPVSPAPQQATQMGEAVTVATPEATQEPEVQPMQEQPAAEAPPTQEQEVEAVIEETTGQGRTYNSLEEVDRAYQAGEVNAGEEITVMTNQGEAVFVINENGSVRRVR